LLSWSRYTTCCVSSLSGVWCGSRRAERVRGHH